MKANTVELLSKHPAMTLLCLFLVCFALICSVNSLAEEFLLSSNNYNLSSQFDIECSYACVVPPSPKVEGLTQTHTLVSAKMSPRRFALL